MSQPHKTPRRSVVSKRPSLIPEDSSMALIVSSEFVTMADPATITQQRPELVPQRLSDQLQTASSTSWIWNSQFEQDYDFAVVNPEQSKVTVTESSHNSVKRRKVEEHADLEAWWLHSPIWRRTVPIMCIIMLFLSILHAGLAVYYFTAEDKSADDFDVCKTQGCRDIANWILEGLDPSFNPCEDFYRFTCNKYSDPSESGTNPGHLDLSTAKFQFNERGVLANVLKPGVDPQNVIVPFYKACLNTRRRNARDFEALSTIVNMSMPFLFTDPINFSRPEGSSLVKNSVGHTGYANYHLRLHPNVSFLPPPAWITDYQQQVSTESGRKMFYDDVLITYKALWAQLERYIGKPKLEVQKAANLTVETVALLSSLDLQHGGSLNDPEVRKRLETLVTTLLGNEWVQEPILVDGKFFTEGDFETVILEFLQKFENKNSSDEDNVGPALLGIWILSTLEYYGMELTNAAYNQLKLDRLFPHIQPGFQSESFCLESLAEHLNGHSFNLFAQSLENTNSLAEMMGEEFRRIRRAMREIYFVEKIGNDFKPFDSYVLRNFMNPGNKITLNYPFPKDATEANLFQELGSYQSSFQPGPDHLLNIWNSTFNRRLGELRSWRDGKRNHLLYQNFKLEKLENEIDDTVEYGNNLYPPIVLFDKPLFLNDMRVFDLAGSIFYVARSFLELWGKNLENQGPLEHLQEFGPYESLRPFKNVYNGQCLQNNTRILRERFYSSDMSKDVLALIIASRMYKNPDRYSSLTRRSNGSFAPSIEYFYHENRTFDYVQVVAIRDHLDPNAEGVFGYEQLNKSDFFILDHNPRKFHFRRAPNGLERFTEDQLFFLAAMRHECHTLSEDEASKRFVESANILMQQTNSFAEAWTCPLGAPMNPPNKCVQRSTNIPLPKTNIT